MSEFKIRPHHGLCTAFFVGEGYDSDFTANMAEKIEFLNKSEPIITLTIGADMICEKCPNNLCCKCTSTKPDTYDKKVLEITEFSENIELK